MMAAWLFVGFALASVVGAPVFAARRSGGDTGAFWAEILDWHIE